MTNITGYLYNPLGAVVTEGILYITLQQDMTSVGGNKIAPFTVEVNLASTSGYVDVDLEPTVGASPAGLAYRVEFDPDPLDTSRPMKTKDGYWRNYWSVPNTASVAIGTFTSALRGEPSNNYMPLGGTVGSISGDIALGTAADTNRTISAPQTSFTPRIRFNATTDQWEFTNDGTTYQNMLQGGGGAVGGDLSGTVGSATVIRIRGSAVSSTAPSATGQYLRWNTGTSQYEPSTDGSLITNIAAGNIASGTVPLARISGLTDAQISASAAIAYTKVNFSGSIIQFTRVGFGGAADTSAVAKFVGQYYSPVVAGGNAGTAKTFNFDLGNEHSVTLNSGTCTFTFSNPKDGARYLLNLFQDATGSRLVTWPANVVWPSGVAPTLTTTPNRMDMFVFFYNATTAKYYGAFNLNYN